MQGMKPYSEDLRTRIVRAVQEGEISRSLRRLASLASAFPL